MVAVVELPWALDVPPAPRRVLDVPPPDDAPVAVDDPGALARGVLVGLAVSAPLWLGFVWLVSSLVALLPLR